MLSCLTYYELREDIDVYISWAAVITSSREIRKDYVRFMDALEIDLQAMWMYTYCLLQDLGCPDTETASSLSLRKITESVPYSLQSVHDDRGFQHARFTFQEFEMR